MPDVYPQPGEVQTLLIIGGFMWIILAVTTWRRVSRQHPKPRYKRTPSP